MKKYIFEVILEGEIREVTDIDARNLIQALKIYTRRNPNKQLLEINCYEENYFLYKIEKMEVESG